MTRAHLDSDASFSTTQTARHIAYTLEPRRLGSTEARSRG